MKTSLKTSTAVFVVFCMTAFAAIGFAQEYKALEGVNTVKTIYDVRTSNPMSAMEHLTLVLETYNAPAIQKVTDKPEFAVVFMGPSVTLLSNDRTGFTEEDRQTLKKMDKVISDLAEAGVRLEICEVAANYFKVDLNQISPKIERVGNGWISSLGYQLKGYALIPIY